MGSVRTRDMGGILAKISLSGKWELNVQRFLRLFGSVEFHVGFPARIPKRDKELRNGNSSSWNGSCAVFSQ